LLKTANNINVFLLNPGVVFLQSTERGESSEDSDASGYIFLEKLNISWKESLQEVCLALDSGTVKAVEKLGCNRTLNANRKIQ